jgi:hypothetical protein
MKKLEICIWFITALRSDIKDLDNLDFDFCRKKCQGKDINCIKYLRGEYKQWEYDYYRGEQCKVH